MERSGDQAWGCCDDPRPSSTGAVDLGDCPRVGHRPEDGSPNDCRRPGGEATPGCVAARLVPLGAQIGTAGAPSKEGGERLGTPTSSQMPPRKGALGAQRPP